MAASSETVKRDRKSNYNDTELSCLIDQYSQHANTLQSKHGGSATNREKSLIWDAITTEVNLRSGSDLRTVAELKKKWTEMKATCIRLMAARRTATGTCKAEGGQRSREPWYVDYVLDIVGVDTAMIESVGTGGKDDTVTLTVTALEATGTASAIYVISY